MRRKQLPGFVLDPKPRPGYATKRTWSSIERLQDEIPCRVIFDWTDHVKEGMRGFWWSDRGIAGSSHGPYPSLELCFLSQQVIPLRTYYLHMKYPTPEDVARVNRIQENRYPSEDAVIAATQRILDIHPVEWKNILSKLKIEVDTLIERAALTCFQQDRDDQYSDILRVWLKERSKRHQKREWQQNELLNARVS